MKKSHIAVILFSVLVASLAGLTGCNKNETLDSVPEIENVSCPKALTKIQTAPIIP